MAELKLLIVADDTLARAGLAHLLANTPDCTVLWQGNSADVADELADMTGPDVIIWDVGWELPIVLPDWVDFGLPVVALLPDGAEAGPVWAAGIQALVRRDVAAEALAVAARAAAQELVVLDAEVAAALLPVVRKESGLETAVESLTIREREVLQLVAEGLTNKAIAARLQISDHTVKFHVNAIMNKVGAQSRTEAVVRATRHGLILL